MADIGDSLCFGSVAGTGRQLVGRNEQRKRGWRDEYRDQQRAGGSKIFPVAMALEFAGET